MRTWTGWFTPTEVIGYEFGIISPLFIPNPAPGLGAEVSKIYVNYYPASNSKPGNSLEGMVTKIKFIEN